MLPLKLRFSRVMLALLTIAAVLVEPCSGGVLVTDEEARRSGLKRAWFSQVDVDAARHRVVKMVLHDDQLIALTTAGVLQAFDAHSGKTLWSSRLGNPDYPSLGPALSDQHIALVNGSTLFVLDRFTGRELVSRRVGGGVGGAPSLTATHVFVPLFKGAVEGYSLEAPRRSPWTFRGAGRIFQPAVASADSVVWSTDRNRLYVGAGDAKGVRFRFLSSAPIVAPPAVRTPRVFAGSLAGYVFALDEKTGQQLWRYAAGAAVTRAPIEIANWLFVVTEGPALHALDATTGRPKWTAEGVTQFVAANPNRVYGLDAHGGLIAMDVETGVVHARARSRGGDTAVLNDETDRLYVYAPDGLVQCFYELGADRPLYHRPKAPAETSAESPRPGVEQPSGEQPTDPSPGDAEAPDPFSEPAADPFNADPDEPAAEPGPGVADDPEVDGADDDPFSSFDDPF